MKNKRNSKKETNTVAELTAKNLDWTKIVKGFVWDGLEYKLKLNSDGTIFADSVEEKRNMPKEIVVEIMDLYDLNGKCVSKYKNNR